MLSTNRVTTISGNYYVNVWLNPQPSDEIELSLISDDLFFNLLLSRDEFMSKNKVRKRQNYFRNIDNMKTSQRNFKIGCQNLSRHKINNILTS